MSTGYSITARKYWAQFLAVTVPLPSVSSEFYPFILVATTMIIGVAVAWLPLKTAILVVSGVAFLTLLLIEPAIGILVLIPVIPLSSLLAVSVGGAKAGAMELVLVLTLAAGLLKIMVSRSISGQPFKIQTGPLLVPFLALLGGVSLSWLNTLSIGASLVETAKWIEMFALYLFVINLFPVRYIKWAVLVIILTGMALALLGLYQFIFKVGPEGFLLFNGRFLRAYGTFAQPNPYAGYLGLILPLGLSLTMWAIEQNFNRPQLGQKIFQLTYQLFKLALILLPLGLMLAALFASQSRGAWVGFVAAGLATLIVRSKKITMLFLAFAVIAIFIGLISSFDLNIVPTTGPADDSASPYAVVSQRFAEAVAIITISDVATTPVTDANFATIERLAHWQAAREMWRDNLWLGVGFGNYAVIYPAYAVGRWLDPLGHAHNYLLNIGAEAGLIGITAYLIFWIFAFGLLWVIVQQSDAFYKAVAAGAVGIMVHLHIHNLVDNLYVQGMYLHVAIILSLVSAIYLYNKESAQLTTK